MDSHKPFVVGLAGGSGSGKTTLANIIATSLPWDVTVVSLDRFYKDLSHLPLSERLQVNFDHPDSLDFDALGDVLHNLHHGQQAHLPVYDFAQCNPTGEYEAVAAAPVVLVEGMQVLYHVPLLSQFDLSIFLNIDEPTRFQRKLERDMRERGRSYENVIDMWHTRTQPMHGDFVQPTLVRADLVFTQSFAPQVVEVTTNAIRHRASLRSCDPNCNEILQSYTTN